MLLFCDSAQGVEGVSLTHCPASALHVQPPPAEDSGSHADDSQLVSVCMDCGRPAEPGQEHSSVCHSHHSRRAGL